MYIIIDHLYTCNISRELKKHYLILRVNPKMYFFIKELHDESG